FFLALCEAAAGLRTRIQALNAFTVRAAAGVFIAFLAVMSINRSAVFTDAIYLMDDAAHKQPLSAFAHYGLSCAYAAEWQKMSARSGVDPKLVNTLKRMGIRERTTFLEC